MKQHNWQTELWHKKEGWSFDIFYIFFWVMCIFIAPLIISHSDKTFNELGFIHIYIIISFIFLLAKDISKKLFYLK